MTKITLPLAVHHTDPIVVEFSPTEPLPTGTPEQTNPGYFKQAKTLVDVLQSAPSGMVDRVLWLLLSQELEERREAVNARWSNADPVKLQKIFDAWEVIAEKVL